MTNTPHPESTENPPEDETYMPHLKAYGTGCLMSALGFFFTLALMYVTGKYYSQNYLFYGFMGVASMFLLMKKKPAWHHYGIAFVVSNGGAYLTEACTAFVLRLFSGG